MKRRTLWILVAVLTFGAVGASARYAISQEPASAAVNATLDPDRFDPQEFRPAVRRGTRRSMLKTDRLQSGLTADQTRQLKDNCLWGKPKLTAGADVGPTRMVYRDGYVLEHSSEAKVPFWVCEHCTTAELTGTLRRTNPFKADPQLLGFPRAELSDYKNSGYDRGHLCPNGNFKSNDTLRKETFFLSNMVPQVGEGFNRNIWADLEGQVRTWTKARNESWIISGAMFYDPEEDNPATADGVVDITVIGDNDVEVPTHLFKIVVTKNASGVFECLAFVMENTVHSDSDFTPHIRTVRWIEDRTGFDFMPNMNTESGISGLQARLEETKTALWP